MPIYVWNCAECGDMEVYRPIADYQVPPEHPHPVSRVISAAYAHADIKPYRAVTGDVAGKFIEGRKQHREFLKRNRLIEVGDAKPLDTSKPRPTIKKGEIREALKQSIAQHCVPDFRKGGLVERHGSR